jgi:hypothetical protein
LPSPEEKQYGRCGWKEFRCNRDDILYEFDRARKYNSSRPVQTEHGNAAEAELRRWLSGYLPIRFGVTSGYVIPDVVVASYELYHFDVIIYDAMASPVLWTDGNRDRSEQGKKRAIPAKHVRSVFEVKAGLSAETAKDAIKKLGQLNSLATHLPSAFSCNTLFYDLDVSLIEKQNIIPTSPIVGYWGGVVLRCLLDKEMTGLIEVFPKPQEADAQNLNIPLAKSLESLEIGRDAKGDVVLRGQGTGVEAFSDGEKWHFSKVYGPTVYGPLFGLTLNWSHNNFARFALDLLSRLEGVPPRDDVRHMSGQVFDNI